MRDFTLNQSMQQNIQTVYHVMHEQPSISNSIQNRQFQIWVFLSRTYIKQLVHKYRVMLRKYEVTQHHFIICNQLSKCVNIFISGFSFVEVKIHFLTVACIIAINTVVCDRESGHSEIRGLKRLIIPSLSSEHLSKWRTTSFLYLKYLPHLPQQNCLKSECTFWWAFNAVAGPSLEAHTFTSSCRSTCLLRLTLRLNFFWQMSHVNQVPSLCDVHSNGFSPLWSLLCLARWHDLVNRLPQTVHSKGFSPLWTLLCWTRLPDLANRLPQTVHSNGLSPLWTLLCWTRLPDLVNRLPQTVHSNGFSPEWLRLCSLKCALVPQHLPHSVHLYISVWVFLWWCRAAGDKKRLLHSLHEYQFSLACNVLHLLKCFFVVNRLSHSLRLSLCEWSVVSVRSPLASSSMEIPAYAHHSKCTNIKIWQGLFTWTNKLVSWSFNVPFQHKYGNIRDKKSGVESYPYPVKEHQWHINFNRGHIFIQMKWAGHLRSLVISCLFKKPQQYHINLTVNKTIVYHLQVT